MDNLDTEGLCGKRNKRIDNEECERDYNLKKKQKIEHCNDNFYKISEYNNQHLEKGRKKNVFEFRNFSINQDICAMKVGTDAVILAGFGALDNSQVNLIDNIWQGNDFILDDQDKNPLSPNLTDPKLILVCNNNNNT